MNITPLALADVLLIEPQVYEDERGCFFESFQQARFEAALGRPLHFVQDNQSTSRQGVLRGLHFQLPQSQGKLVQVLAGEIYDVAVDLRPDSQSRGAWVGVRLSAFHRHQLWIPEGFAHGFLALSDQAQVLYKTTDYYAPAHEHCLAWDDPDLDIDWPLQGSPWLSAKDRQGLSLAEALRVAAGTQRI